jgi:hypothetical protein
LGKCLTLSGKFSEAENLLLESFSHARSAENNDLNKLINQIIHMYNMWNKPNQAKEFAIYLKQK